MPHSEFDVKAVVGGRLHVGGSVVGDEGETVREESLRVVWVVEQRGASVSGVVRVEDGRWDDVERDPPLPWTSLWPVFGYGILIPAGDEVPSRSGASRAHPAAFVWSETLELEFLPQ